MRDRRLIALALVALLLPPGLAWGEAPEGSREPRTCLITVQDLTGRGAIKKTRARLEAALRQAGFKVLPRQRFVVEAKRARIPRRRREDPDSIATVAAALDLDTALRARLRRQGGSYQLVLDAMDPASGEIWAHALVRLRRPRPSPAQARECVGALRASLDQVEGYHLRLHPEDRPAEPPAPTEGAVDHREDDDADWGFDSSGFDSIADSPPLAGIEVEWGGRVELDHASYPVRLEDKVNARNALDLALSAKAKKQNLLIAGTLLARHDLSNPDRDRLEAEEAYVQLNFDPVEIRAGRTILSWGSMSLLNPTDLLNPMDLREPLSPEKLGVWVMRARLILGSFALEGYWLPVAEQSQTPFFEGLDDEGRPQSRSRWLDVEIEDRDDVPLRYQLSEPEVPEPGLDHWQGALRASASLWGADLALAGGSIYDRLPVLTTELTPAPPFVDVELRRRHERLYFATAEAEVALGKWRFAGEGLAVLTTDPEGEDPDVPNPYFTVGAGVDYRSSEIFSDHRLHLFVDVVWTEALVGTLRESDLDDLRFPLGLAMLSRVRYEFGQDLRLDLNLLASLERIDAVWNPEIEYLVGDNLSVQLGLMFLLGEKEQGFFGRYHDNSMLTFQVEANF